MPDQVGGDLFDDRFRRLLIFRGGIGPLAAGMPRVPRRALVDPGFRAVAVPAQAVADLRFRIADRVEEVDEVVLGQFLEARLHDQLGFGGGDAVGERAQLGEQGG